MEKTILTRESGHCPFKLLKKLFCFFTGKLDSLELQKHIIFKISFNQVLIVTWVVKSRIRILIRTSFQKITMILTSYRRYTQSTIQDYKQVEQNL